MKPCLPVDPRGSHSCPLLTRRQALVRLAVSGVALAAGTQVRASVPPRLRLAFFGVGGRGRANVLNLADHHRVAFADVDDNRAAEIYTQYPEVPRFRDYRKLLDRHAAEIDGIVISTPDHWHLDMGLAAIRAGKHVYLEKPLATTIGECRALQRAAAESRVVTQLGVQGHSFEGLRVLREWIDAGAVGRVSSVVMWADRMRPHDFVAADAPLPGMTVPDTFNWDLWLGPRPSRPYHPSYAPSRWRNWWDFGSGAVTDIGVHMFDVLSFVFELGFPELVQAVTPERRSLTAPEWTKVQWRFGREGGKAPVSVSWIGGYMNGVPLKPDVIPGLPRHVVDAAGSGMAFVGTEGTLFIPDMRASSRPRIFPAGREREFIASRPPRSLERPKGGHWKDWTDAIQAGRPASAPFSYGAPLTEKVLLATIAQRTGKPVRWLPDEMRFIDNEEAGQLLHPAVRTGWSAGT